MSAQLLATVGISISLIALAGHASQKKELYEWGFTSYVGMAIPTAVAILAIGIGLFIVIEFLKRHARHLFFSGSK